MARQKLSLYPVVPGKLTVCCQTDFEHVSTMCMAIFSNKWRICLTQTTLNRWDSYESPYQLFSMKTVCCAIPSELLRFIWFFIHCRNWCFHTFKGKDYITKPITVAARSKAWIVFTRSNTGIMGSNPTRGMDIWVRLFCVYVLLCVGRVLATGWSPVQRVLPIVYRIKKLKSIQGQTKGYRAIDYNKGAYCNSLTFIYIYFNCKWVFTLWQWYYNKTQHTNNTHHTK
jgi:hypothetical protein